MEYQGKWIKPGKEMGEVCPVFRKNWRNADGMVKTELLVTALGVYEARIKGKRVSDYVLAPGWTAYRKRLQYQVYDITDLSERENELWITVGKGWFRSPMPGWFESEDKERRKKHPAGLLAEIRIEYADGHKEVIPTNSEWECGASSVRFSEIYDGESFDACFRTGHWEPAEVFEWPTDILIPQEGEKIREQERVGAKAVFTTPAGERVVDFGQVITGYVEFTVIAKAGERVRMVHGEVLDDEGNFYNANYRSAKAQLSYICREGKQTWHPGFTFFGFRYLKLEEFPQEGTPEQFTAIAVYSDMKQTGRISCSDEGLNQLFSNILWGQRGNFLDVPTDCPQRDERLGWTGDVAAFVKAASFNFDVEVFFTKWLHDLSAEQREDGGVGHVIPDYLPDEVPSAAWGDTAVICPWEIYLTYGNKQILREQFDSMKKWVGYITAATVTPYLWTGGKHYGDWLGLDAPVGSYKGSSREDFIASAYYAWSTQLLIKAGRILEEDVEDYQTLYEEIVKAFRAVFPDYHTQTEHVLAVWFGLSEDPAKTAAELAAMIAEAGGKLQTGFVGTPFLLHVLSRYGYTELAYKLLLRKEYPSWLYAVEKGATTVWEHWDGVMEDGSFWSADMNSFNHYAYGAAVDWIYEVAAGICRVEEAPGFRRVKIAPHPDRRLAWLEGSLETRYGVVRSRWSWVDGQAKYEIETPVPALIVIEGREREVPAGKYVLWGN